MLMVEFQSEPTDLRTKRVDGVNFNMTPVLKAEQDPCPSSKTIRPRE